jgi:excisionase family DNA binding protein
MPRLRRPSQPPSEEPLLYDFNTVCKKLSISRASLYRLIERKEISSVKVGKKRVYITAEELNRYVKSLTQRSE